MILFVNEKGEIKDVETTNKSGLTTLVISDNDNPFDGWSKAKICCYRVQVMNERIVMFTPYIDSRIMEQLDSLGTVTDDNATEIIATQEVAVETYESQAKLQEDNLTNQEAIVELYELIGGIE